MEFDLKPIILECVKDASKMTTTNALTCIQKGLEAYKEVEIPISKDGRYCRIPYRDNKEVQTFVDFMLVYLDEAIKSLTKEDKSE